MSYDQTTKVYGIFDQDSARDLRKNAESTTVVLVNDTISFMSRGVTAHSSAEALGDDTAAKYMFAVENKEDMIVIGVIPASAENTLANMYENIVPQFASQQGFGDYKMAPLTY
jgi:hypothetical protein